MCIVCILVSFKWIHLLVFPQVFACKGTMVNRVEGYKDLVMKSRDDRDSPTKGMIGACQPRGLLRHRWALALAIGYVHNVHCTS